jgi:prolyl-tRNA synthetase
MLQSQLFTKTSKDSLSDSDSINADLLTRAGFIGKTMAGVYSFLPLGYRVIRKIEQIVREEMDGIGGQEILMSALAPKTLWEKTGRWNSVDVLFKVPAAGDQEYALNPTHEEVVVPLARTFLRSYRDLPFSCYQIQTKFRNELRAKSGVLRGREFIMKDLYSFHRDEADLDRFYGVAQGAYDRIFERLGLGDRTYLTYASGGTFSKYSHEYQVLLPQGEDQIYVSVEAEKQGKRIAINKEIFEEGTTVCPATGGKEFRPERASEAGNIFKLGTKFSEPFALQFTDEAGKVRTPVMGCYGIGISRLMGVLAEAFGDKDGLRWPEAVAPFRTHIVPLAKSRDEESWKVAEQLSQKLPESLLDDRIDLSTGARFADSDLIGISRRIVISPKSLKAGGVEVRERMTGASEILAVDRL